MRLELKPGDIIKFIGNTVSTPDFYLIFEKDSKLYSKCLWCEFPEQIGDEESVLYIPFQKNYKVITEDELVEFKAKYL
jgi:hypothetical protein